VTDPIASQSVLVVPDTKNFATLLKAELEAAQRTVKPLAVPVTPSLILPRGVQQQLAQKEAVDAQAASYKRLGVAVAEAARLQELETAASTRAVAAHEALLAVDAAGLDLTRRLSILKAQRAAAEQALTLARESLTAAEATSVPVTIEAARAELGQAEAMAIAARQAVLEEAALIRNTAAVATNAAAHEAAGRAVFANTASALGLRGAVLASSNAFIAGTIATIGFQKTIAGAAEDEERAAAAIRLLGEEIGGRLVRSADELANTIGVSDEKILAFTTTVGQMLTAIGLTGNQIETMSTELAKLGPALALAFGTDVEQALTALRSGLAGNVRGLRVYGFALDNTQVKQRALINTGKENAAELTKQEVIYARYQLILEQSANAADFFTQEQGSLSAQTAILSTNVDDLADSIGGKLLPLIIDLAKTANFAAQSVRDFAGFMGDAKQGVEGFIPGGERTVGIFGRIVKEVGTFAALGPALGPLNLLRRALDDSGDAASRAFLKYQQFFQGFDLGEAMLENAADALERFEERANRIDLSNATVEITNLQVALDRLIIAGAGPAAQIVNLKAQQAAQRAKEIAARRAGDKEKEREAIAAQAALQKQIDSLQAGIEADAAAAARDREQKAKAAATAAQKALDAADQRLLFEQQQRQSAQDIANAKADATSTLRDDIREGRDQIRLLTRQIQQAEKIHDHQQRLATIAALTLARVNARIKLEEDIAQREENLREKRRRERERARDRAAELVEILDISAQIAEVEERTGDQIRFLELEIKALIRQRKLEDETSVEYKRLTLAIARKRKELKELKDEQNKVNREAQAVAFAFLQQQQGFAATLLSNILPGSAFAGTVGGGAIAPAVPPPLITPQAAVVTAAQKGAGPASPTAGQQATVIEILRQILNALLRQRRSFGAAHHQTSVGGATADIL
jgi:hypothetical protein